MDRKNGRSVALRGLPRGSGAGRRTGTNRVNRGSGWFNEVWQLRSSYRFGSFPDYRDRTGLGFRLLRTEQPVALLPFCPMQSNRS